MGLYCCKSEEGQEAKEIDDYNQNTYGNTYTLIKITRIFLKHARRACMDIIVLVRATKEARVFLN